MADLTYLDVLKQAGSIHPRHSLSLLERAAHAAAHMLQEQFTPTVVIRAIDLCYSELRFNRELKKLALRTGAPGGRCRWEDVGHLPEVLDSLVLGYDTLLEARRQALEEEREERDYFNTWSKTS